MEKIDKKIGGISANSLVMPIVIVLIILHILIIGLIVAISSSSSSLSTIMRNSGAYTQDATSLLAGSSLLSETASTYILMPVNENGEVNVGPLSTYAQELGSDRRGSQVLARFETYDVDESAVALLSSAADSANYMLEAQIHAISLVRTVYPLPRVTPLTSIPTVELTEEEKAMTPEEKIALARTLVQGSVYGLNKQAVSQNVNGCVEIIQQNSAVRSAQTARQVTILRSVLWGTTLSIILILIFTFSALYTQILLPLGRFVKLIPEDKKLSEDKGFREVRLVASAYNGVLERRNALDEILRSAAETDALTSLPNRYRFEQYLLEAEDSGYSVAAFLFDVNYLKRTNDTEGHLAGDKLIRMAAECISSCFGENCFRIGGDEFAAIVKNCTPDSILKTVDQFEKIEKDENVSISLGYAYTEEIGNTSFKRLLDEADKNMYAQKKNTHSQRE
ncbi:MAG: GGDEF domain-containing protein [Clostridia bacterium]|nr:GGDEF domain-containing protein [Clostridia bacterium]